MSSFIDALEAGIGLIKSNPIVKQYAEPVIQAVLTGSGEIVLSDGTIKLTKQNQTVPFDWKTAIYAVLRYATTDDLEIQIGAEQIEWVGNGSQTAPTPQPIITAPTPIVPAPAAS